VRGWFTRGKCIAMFYGYVKKLSDRGFGFIGQEGGPDVYFHASQLAPDEFARIRPEQPVMFELAKRDPSEKPAERKGLRAAVVKLIDRMPGGVLPPPPQTMAPRHHPRSKRRKATWKRKIELPRSDSDSGLRREDDAP
jgi:cold shock CspA family protein